jgi:shikimate kinase
MKNIVLIGMPGAGKSTVGVILAKTLGRKFIDTDLLIQQRQGRFLQEIIDRVGIEGFIAIEENVILELEASDCVIATGGSVIYSSSAMRRLKSDGVLVYLKLPYDEIEKRIKNISSRGIAMGRGQNLAGLYEQRTPLYEMYADIVIDCAGMDMESVVSAIKAAL